MTSTSLPLDKLRLDGGTQSRVAIDEKTVDDYAEDMKKGDTFPTLVVFYDGTDYWLADGFHRVHAAKKAGLAKIGCDVRQGDQRAAILHSVGANSNHGKRRTNEDKQQAVRTLLTNEAVKVDPATGEPWSDRQIAKICAVTHPFVGRVRSDLSLVTVTSDSGKRTYTDRWGNKGTMNADGINKGRKKRTTSPADNAAPSQSSANTDTSDAGEADDDEEDDDGSTPHIPSRATPEAQRKSDLISLLVGLLGGGSVNVSITDYVAIALREHMTGEAFFAAGRQETMKQLRGGTKPSLAVQGGKEAIHRVHEHILAMADIAYREGLERFDLSTEELIHNRRYAAVATKAFHQDTPVEEAITAAEMAAKITGKK